MEHWLQAGCWPGMPRHEYPASGAGQFVPCHVHVMFFGFGGNALATTMVRPSA